MPQVKKRIGARPGKPSALRNEIPGLMDSLAQQPSPSSHMPELPTVSTSIFKQLLDGFDIRGIPYASELGRFNLSKGLAYLPGRLPACSFYRFAGEVVDNSGSHEFGFDEPVHSSPEQLILLGASRRAPVLGSLMQCAGRCYGNHTDLARAGIWTNPDGGIWFGMHLHPSIQPEILWPYHGIHLSLLIQIIRYAEPQDWLPQQIILPLEASGLRHVPRWFNQCSILFREGITAVRVDAASLDKPNIAYLRAVRHLADLKPSHHMPGYNTRGLPTATQNMESVLLTFLRATQSAPSYHLMAEMFGISERTLNRKLQAEGQNYRGLVRKVRIELSKGYLKDSNAKIQTIANMLGYPRCSSFIRSFQELTGMSPTEYRLNGRP